MAAAPGSLHDLFAAAPADDLQLEGDGEDGLRSLAERTVRSVSDLEARRAPRAAAAGFNPEPLNPNSEPQTLILKTKYPKP